MPEKSCAKNKKRSNRMATAKRHLKGELPFYLKLSFIYINILM